MQLLLGKPVADSISSKLIQEVKNLEESCIVPKLAIVRMGNNENDLAYERGAKNRCNKIGIELQVHELNVNASQEELLDTIDTLNNDKSVNGILVFRPLPKHIDENIVKYRVDEKKDVDSFNPINFSKLYQGNEDGFAPCTAEAVLEILDYYEINPTGKNVSILGASNVIGKPVSFLLLNRRATITVCHSKTVKTQEITSKSDIVISACGIPKLVTSDYIKEGAIIVDVGINIDENGQLCGDVDFEDVKEKTSMITPVPRGVGSVTTSVLAKHVVKACKMQNNL